MIEIREDGSIPGPDKYGRIYKIIDQMTGEVGYSYTSSDLPGLEPQILKMIEGYDTFAGWMTEILDVEVAKKQVTELNKKKEFVETPHTRLVARVKDRLEKYRKVKAECPLATPGLLEEVLDDMEEMYQDIMGRRERSPLKGWK